MDKFARKRGVNGEAAARLGRDGSEGRRWGGPARSGLPPPLLLRHSALDGVGDEAAAWKIEDSGFDAHAGRAQGRPHTGIIARALELHRHDPALPQKATGARQHVRARTARHPPDEQQQVRRFVGAAAGGLLGALDVLEAGPAQADHRDEAVRTGDADPLLAIGMSDGHGSFDNLFGGKQQARHDEARHVAARLLRGRSTSERPIGESRLKSP
jgi:hypothetical protein